MRRFRILTGLALVAFCLFSCNKPNGGEIPGGGTPNIEKGDHLANVTYQVNVYSFADSDGDGWGDIKGVTQHLDYFENLGVSALWLSPRKLTGRKEENSADGVEVNLTKTLKLRKGKYSRQCICVKLLQPCLTLCNLMDCSLPGSSVHGILQARILE